MEGGNSAGCHVSFRRQVAFTHHHRHHFDADERHPAGAGSRSGQVRREAIRSHVRGLPSQSAWPRQGQVQLDVIVLPPAALHEQSRIGAGARGLPAVGRCPSRQAAVCDPQVAAICNEHIRAVATSAGVGAASLAKMQAVSRAATARQRAAEPSSGHRATGRRRRDGARHWQV
jgi:hypothetical protein